MGLWALTLFADLCLLEFGDVITPGTGASTVSPMIVSVACVVEGFVGLTFFRASFFAPTRLSFSFAKRFFGVALAAVRFGDFPRADLEALRTLPRAVGVTILTVARFLC